LKNFLRQRFGHSVLTAAALLSIVTAVALTPTSAGAQGRARMRGVVTDAAGEPLEGVHVTAFNDSFAPSRFTAESNERGRWAMIGFGGTSARWVFTFELEGHVTTEIGHTVKVMGRNEDLDMILEKVTELGGVGAASGVAADAVNPDNYWDGAAAFEAGDYAGAVASWQTFLSENPEAVAVWLRTAEAYVRLDNTGAAAAAYERVIHLDAENQSALFMLAALKASVGELDDALGYFERVVAKDPENASLYYNIGEIYFQQSRTEEAISFYSRALQVDPEYAAVYQQIGFAYVNAGQTAEAITAFERFLELVPAESEDAAMIDGVLDALRESQ